MAAAAPCSAVLEQRNHFSTLAQQQDLCPQLWFAEAQLCECIQVLASPFRYSWRASYGDTDPLVRRRNTGFQPPWCEGHPRLQGMWATPSAHEGQSTTMLQPYGCAQGSSVHILCSPAHHHGAGDPPSASPGGPGLVLVHLKQPPSPASSCHLLSLLPLQSRDGCAEMEQQRQNMNCYERCCSCYAAEPQLGEELGGSLHC